MLPILIAIGEVFAGAAASVAATTTAAVATASAATGGVLATATAVTGLTAAQLAALIAAGAYLVCKYWPEVVKWASALIPELKKLVRDNRVRGMENAITFFAEKIQNGKALIKSRTFFHDKQHKKWFEKSGITEISEDQVPSHIRRRLVRKEDTDITLELEQETGMSVR